MKGENQKKIQKKKKKVTKRSMCWAERKVSHSEERKWLLPLQHLSHHLNWKALSIAIKVGRERFTSIEEGMHSAHRQCKENEDELVQREEGSLTTFPKGRGLALRGIGHSRGEKPHETAKARSRLLRGVPKRKRQKQTKGERANKLSYVRGERNTIYIKGKEKEELQDSEEEK